MALIKTGDGITEIKGGQGGVSFKRDRSGLHIISKPRRVHTASETQQTQRKAFITARAFSHNNREVSYNIYRALNGLPPATVPPDYYPDSK